MFFDLLDRIERRERRQALLLAKHERHQSCLSNDAMNLNDLNHLAKDNDVEAIEFYFHKNPEKEPLILEMIISILSSGYGHLNMVQKLFELAPNINFDIIPEKDFAGINADKLSLLMYAITNDAVWPKKIVELLIERGVNVNYQCVGGETALMHAVKCNEVEIVQLLLNVPGIDVLCKDDFGKTALDLANKAGHKEIAAILEPYVKLASLQVAEKQHRTKLDNQYQEGFNFFKKYYFEEVNYNDSIAYQHH